MIRLRKPRLYSFYYDLNESYTKFPSVVCSGFEHLLMNTTVYYKIYGDKDLALESECPPKDRNYVLVFKEINITFWSGAAFVWTILSGLVLCCCC